MSAVIGEVMVASFHIGANHDAVSWVTGAATFSLTKSKWDTCRVRATKPATDRLALLSQKPIQNDKKFIMVAFLQDQNNKAKEPKIT